MKDQKIFAGPRLRRLRNRIGLTQSQMATELGISASYLNLIERNQRPLTVQVLLKLASVYDLDMAELQVSADPGLVESLKEIFSDPLLATELPSPSELEEVAEAAPNVAMAIGRLFDAYQEGQTRLSDLAHMLASDDVSEPERVNRLPFDRVRTWFEGQSPWFANLEEAGEELAETLRLRDDSFGAVKSYLRDQFGVDVRVLPVHTMATERSRFDRHSMRLFLSEWVQLQDRAYLAAIQVAQLGYGGLLEQLSKEAGFPDAEAMRLCRAIMARRLAQAILVPASRLRAAALDLAYDVNALSRRFAVRSSLIMGRLAAVGAMADSALPRAGLVQIDRSGAMLQRLPHPEFPLPRIGGLCGRLPLFDPVPAEKIAACRLELTDGTQFIALASLENGLQPLDRGAMPEILTMLVISEDEVSNTIYAGQDDGQPRPIGVTCRLCERSACTHRSEPPATRPSALQEQIVGRSEYAVV